MGVNTSWPTTECLTSPHHPWFHAWSIWIVFCNITPCITIQVQCQKAVSIQSLEQFKTEVCIAAKLCMFENVGALHP